MTTKIMVRFVTKPTPQPDGSKLTTAVPAINGDVINNSVFQNVVQVGEPRTQQLSDLGIKAGQKFLVIKADDKNGDMKNLLTYHARSLCDEIIEISEFKDYVDEKRECAACPTRSLVLFTNIHKCADCGHGMNIISKFSINKNLDAQVYPLNKIKPGPKPKDKDKIYPKINMTVSPEVKQFWQSLPEPTKFVVDAIKATPECQKFLKKLH